MRDRFLRLLCAAAVAAVLLPALFLPGPVRAQSLLYGKTDVSAPKRTDAGDWNGTWFYVSRLRKMVVWMRDNEGTPEMKVRVQGLQSRALESFTTDWNGNAEYDSHGQHGSFKMSFERRDANTMTGSWVWEIGGEDKGRTETADFTIYRAGRGRQLVWNLSDVRQEFPGDDPDEALHQKAVVWSFQKASRREVLWSELPF